MRMMIIEDEQRARRGLKGLLLATAEEQDEIVAEASNGKDGLELIKTLKPDVVFTDIEMPYINGLELIKNVRKEGLTTIFVIISASAGAGIFVTASCNSGSKSVCRHSISFTPC